MNVKWHCYSKQQDNGKQINQLKILIAIYWETSDVCRKIMLSDVLIAVQATSFDGRQMCVFEFKMLIKNNWKFHMES